LSASKKFRKIKNSQAEGTMKYIKLFSFCVLVFFIIFISKASADIKHVMKEDGVGWIEVSESYKIGYVFGFFTGSELHRREFSFYGADFKIEIKKKEFAEKWDEISLINITAGQIKDGIDAFYKDFSNRRIKVIDVIYIVKMQIEGKNPELIDAQIRYLKMQPISASALTEFVMKSYLFMEKRRRFPTYKEIKNGDFRYEDLLKGGIFIDVNNDKHSLFCYGKYE